MDVVLFVWFGYYGWLFFLVLYSWVVFDCCWCGVVECGFGFMIVDCVEWLSIGLVICDVIVVYGGLFCCVGWV